MIETGTAASGVLQAFRRLANNALGMVQNRAELFAVELQEEKAQLIEILLWVAVLLFFGMMTVLVPTATIIFLSPAEYRIYVAGGFTLLYLVGAVWAFGRLKMRLRSPMPFAQSISEVQKDRESLLK